MLVSGIGMFRANQQRAIENRGSNIGMQSAQIMNEGHGSCKHNQSNTKVMQYKNSGNNFIKSIVNLIKGA